jgi:hypothetical protein
VPGRDIMVQAWYQGGVSVFDFTDPTHPVEIASFDRGPMSATELILSGFWSAYWYNGLIVGSEIARGLDVFRLTPSVHLSKNEIDAANLIHMDEFNAQNQTKLVWPARFVVARAYLDQFGRGDDAQRTWAAPIAKELDRAERLKGAARQAALTKLAARVDTGVNKVGDNTRVRALAAVVRNLAKAK